MIHRWLNLSKDIEGIYRHNVFLGFACVIFFVFGILFPLILALACVYAAYGVFGLILMSTLLLDHERLVGASMSSARVRYTAAFLVVVSSLFVNYFSLGVCCSSHTRGPSSGTMEPIETNAQRRAS